MEDRINKLQHELHNNYITNYISNYKEEDKTKKVNVKRDIFEKTNIFAIICFLILVLGIIIGFIGIETNIGFFVAVGCFLNVLSGFLISTAGYRVMFDEAEEELNRIFKK